MDEGQEFLVRWNEGAAIDAIDFVNFIGPQCIVGHQIALEAADTRKALRLGELLLTAVEQPHRRFELFFALHQVGDVDADPDDSAVWRGAFDDSTPTGTFVSANEIGGSGPMNGHTLDNPRVDINSLILDIAASEVCAQ